MDSYSYFKNINCKHFPCHSIKGDYFNCMFCYCPLYALGSKCGGNYSFTKDGIKDCSECFLPHSECGYNYVISRFDDICDLMCKNKEES